MPKQPKPTLQARVKALEDALTAVDADLRAIDRMAGIFGPYTTAHEKLIVALIRKTGLGRDELGDITAELSARAHPDELAAIERVIDQFFALAEQSRRH